VKKRFSEDMTLVTSTVENSDKVVKPVPQYEWSSYLNLKLEFARLDAAFCLSLLVFTIGIGVR
jgi:hypothetical protein